MLPCLSDQHNKTDIFETAARTKDKLLSLLTETQGFYCSIKCLIDNLRFLAHLGSYIIFFLLKNLALLKLSGSTPVPIYRFPELKEIVGERYQLKIFSTIFREIIISVK